jgi:hypothetical protein
MMYRLYGMAAAMLITLGLAGFSAMDRTTNYKPAKATVSTIDRTCDYVESTRDPGTNKVESARGLTDSCNATEEWEKQRDEVRKTGKRFSGDAVVHVNYTAPQDGSYRTADLHFTGRDDEFYDLQAGSEIKILVSNSDPSKIKKA